MPTYVVAGTTLRTDLDLPELPTVDGPADPARHWDLVAVGAVDPGPVELVFEHERAGLPWRRVRAGDGTVVVEFVGKACFVARTAARRVELVVEPGLAASTLRHLVIDQLVPHLLVVDGGAVLHASAVAVDGEAIAFLGPSGAGKSSLAGGFVQAGATLLADDYLLVREEGGRHLTTAAYPGLRLWGDSATHFAGSADGLPEVADHLDKRRWAVDALAPSAVPLAAVLVLGHDPGLDEPTCQLGALPGRDAFRFLYQQAFRVARSGRERQEAELDRFVRLVEAVPVLLLEHRRRYEDLPEVVATIREVLARVAGSAPS